MSAEVPDERGETRLAPHLEEQFARFQLHNVFTSRREMERLLLRELLTPESRRRFESGEAGIHIVADCYARIYAAKNSGLLSAGHPVSKRFGNPPLTDYANHPGRKLVPCIRHRLQKYYHHHANDPVRITIRKGKYWPIAKTRGQTSDHADAVVVITESTFIDARERSQQCGSKENLRAFDEFFGESSSPQSGKGVVVLQSDLIHELLKNPSIRRKIAGRTSRLYKARSYVNTWDTYGAIALQEEFRKNGREAPTLLLSEHHSSDDNYNLVPFKICMGLGFSSETTRAVGTQSCRPWMRVSRTFGDDVSLPTHLIPPEEETRLTSEPDPENRGFRRLLPRDWNNKYVDLWLEMLPPTKGPEVRDYAMILRQTKLGPPRQVLFVLAGFTERATAIAGKYLAHNWPKLWTKYVKNHAQHGSLGDFFAIIEGPSDPGRAHEWSEDKRFEITPQNLADAGIDCEWTSRTRRAKIRHRAG